MPREFEPSTVFVFDKSEPAQLRLGGIDKYTCSITLF